MDAAVQRCEKRHVFSGFFGVLGDELLQIFPLDVFRNDGPFAVYLPHLPDLRDGDGGFFHPGLIERLIEDVGLGAIGIKDLHTAVAVPVDGDAVLHRDNAVEVHLHPSFTVLPSGAPAKAPDFHTG